MARYPVHRDYAHINITVPLHPAVLPVMQTLTRMLYARQPLSRGVGRQRMSVASAQGNDIPVEIFRPLDQVARGPCLLFIHGGAFALPATGYHKRLICDYTLGCSCTVVSVDYRLVPRYPYPCALEDCASCYAWLIRHAHVLDIDVERIGICGDSAGGALAAALVHIIKARSLAPARFQMLVYPVLDASQSSESMRTCRDTPVWNSRLNRKMWKLYLSGHPGSADDPLASPAHARTLDGLPATYIEVNEFDCLRDEALAYHERLRQSGVAVTLVRNAGTMHGFELNYDSAVTQKIIRTRISYMDTMFSDTRR